MQDSAIPAGTPAPEAPVAETAPDTKNPAMEAFAVKERQLRKMQQELQVEKQRLASESERYKTGFVDKTRLASDPLSVLEEAGFTAEKLSELLMNAPNTQDPAFKLLKAEIQKLQSKQDAAEQRMQDDTKQRYDHALKQIDREAQMLVDSDENYETIKATGKHAEITKLIEEEFNTTGVLLDVKDAAKQVEERLVEEGLKYASLSKIKSKLAPPPVEAPKSQPTSPQTQIKTLTQSMPVNNNAGKTSEQERIARAMAAFKGTLNK